jgi:ABC-2 type transport system permease protein
MSSSVFWALVRKDLYLMRGFMIATIATGVLAAVLTNFGKIGFAVGGILFVTADIASGIFIAMYSLVGERKGQSRMFSLSLPISGFRHDLTKLLAGYLTYSIPWLVLTGLALGTFLLPAAASQRGMIVYVLVLQVFSYALFSVIFAALFVVASEWLSGLVILVVNICFSLFMVELNQPQIMTPLHGPAIVWTAFAIAMMFADALLIAFSLAFALFITSRRRDYI